MPPVAIGWDADDPMAVTDNQGRIHGAQGLRVVDASIMPCVPCAYQLPDADDVGEDCRHDPEQS